MKVTLVKLLAVLAPFHLGLVLAQDQDTPPDEVVKNCAKDNEIPVKYNGRWNCMRCAEVPYTDPKTGYPGCCDLGQKFAVDAAYPKEGACCQENQIYSFDPTTSKGSCCANGQKFKKGACIPATDPLPPPHCPTCTKDYVCGCDGNLGLQYGHCYTMTDVNGLHLNRQTDGIYQTGGEVDNLIFKVCKSTDDCDEDKDTYVPDDGNWYLQDQIGFSAWKGPGWFGNQAPHMGIVDSSNKAAAAKFNGEAFCMFGDCAICLRLPDNGLVAPCPMAPTQDRTHIGPSANKNNCKAYRFQETKCVKGVPAKV